MLRALLFYFIRVFFKVFTRLEIEGLGNIPSTGAAILAPNHLAIMDAPLIFSQLERQDATGLVGDSCKKHPIIH